MILRQIDKQMEVLKMDHNIQILQNSMFKQVLRNIQKEKKINELQEENIRLRNDNKILIEETERILEINRSIKANYGM